MKKFFIILLAMAGCGTYNPVPNPDDGGDNQVHNPPQITSVDVQPGTILSINQQATIKVYFTSTDETGNGDGWVEVDDKLGVHFGGPQVRSGRTYAEATVYFDCEGTFNIKCTISDNYGTAATTVTFYVTGSDDDSDDDSNNNDDSSDSLKGAVHITVCDQDDNLVEGALVTVVQKTEIVGEQYKSQGYTDSNGNYELTDAPYGNYSISVACPTFSDYCDYFEIATEMQYLAVTITGRY